MKVYKRNALKKGLLLLSALCLLTAAPSCGARQDGETSVPQESVTDFPADRETPVSEFEWEYVSGGVKITRYLGSDAQVIVPSVIDNKKVVDIGNTFEGNIVLESLTLPDSITVLEGRPVEGCDALKVLRAPGVREIEGSVYTKALEELYLPALRTAELYSLDMDTLKKLDISGAESIYLANRNGVEMEFTFPSLQEAVVSEKLVISRMETDPHSFYDEERGEWIAETFLWYVCSEEVRRQETEGYPEGALDSYLRSDEWKELNWAEIFDREHIVVNGVEFHR